jgi:hypothetical protein
MDAASTPRIAAWRSGILVCATLALGTPGALRAASPPITIPPASQIAPPSGPASAPSSAPPAAAPTLRALLPTRIETLRDPQGAGIVISGELTGTADSATAMLAAIFAYSAAFDPTPKPRLAVSDQNDRSAQALFTATVHGVPVIGVAVVALRDTGGDVSVFYDYPDSFAASFPRLRQALGHGSDNLAAALAPLHLADGSTVGVAPGWRVIGQGKGVVDLAGPQGEFLSLGDTIPVYAGNTLLAGSVAQAPCCDPVAAFRAAFPQLAANAMHRGLPPQLLTGILDSAESAAPTGGQGAFILGSVSVGGRAYSDVALAYAIGSFTDPWTFRLSSIMAPQAVLTAELPVLLQIWASFSADEPGLAPRLPEAARSLEALRPLLQPEAAPQATEANASEGWSGIIPEIATSMGGGEVDSTIAAKLTDRLGKDSGRTWRVVPIADAK